MMMKKNMYQERTEDTKDTKEIMIQKLEIRNKKNR